MKKPIGVKIKILSIGFLFSLILPTKAEVVFSEDFNGYNGGNQNGIQYLSYLKCSFGGRLPLWINSGLSSVHAVAVSYTHLTLPTKRIV